MTLYSFLFELLVEIIGREKNAKRSKNNHNLENRRLEHEHAPQNIGYNCSFEPKTTNWQKSPNFVKSKIIEFQESG